MRERYGAMQSGFEGSDEQIGEKKHRYRKKMDGWRIVTVLIAKAT